MSILFGILLNACVSQVLCPQKAVNALNINCLVCTTSSVLTAGDDTDTGTAAGFLQQGRMAQKTRMKRWLTCSRLLLLLRKRKGSRA